MSKKGKQAEAFTEEETQPENNESNAPETAEPQEGKQAEAFTEEPASSGITTEEQAKELVRSKYAVPDWCKVVLVTEDSNVFWDNAAGSAVNHATKNSLKLFRISWQDLAK